MRIMLVLVLLLGLAAHPTMAAPPGDTGVKKSTTGQKPTQKKPAAPQPHEGSMAVVPAGEFTMGSSTGDADEQPAHQVYVDTFSMDTHEVTVEQYAAFLQTKGIDPPSGWKTMNQPAHHKRPVANVDWRDAVAYCTWAGKRLPTEAEWEKAARGTDGRIFPWGNDPPTPLHANFGKTDWNNHRVLAPVGTLKNGKSPYGIYDMAGNVREWVSDWYGQDYYTNSPARNPTGPASGESKVLRGGSWGSDAQQLRSSLRYFHRSAHRHKDYGFRCVKTQ